MLKNFKDTRIPCQINCKTLNESMPPSKAVRKIHIDCPVIIKRVHFSIITDSRIPNRLTFLQLSNLTTSQSIDTLLRCCAKNRLTKLIYTDNETLFSSVEFAQFVHVQTAKHATVQCIIPKQIALQNELFKFISKKIWKISGDTQE